MLRPPPAASISEGDLVRGVGCWHATRIKYLFYTTATGCCELFYLVPEETGSTTTGAENRISGLSRVVGVGWVFAEVLNRSDEIKKKDVG